MHHHISDSARGHPLARGSGGVHLCVRLLVFLERIKTSLAPALCVGAPSGPCSEGTSNHRTSARDASHEPTTPYDRGCYRDL
eukprot:5730905-Prymnesium_polylepis.1